ncbi:MULTISPECIES: Fic/DOC family protein [unclassified Sedimentibacter]|uniref:Fic/DOC family protein n=1 Tax=unclassified Sedimentibacter TaxID=2649220 RepID=UPI0027DF9664|nr:Fic family protein [Sedimentibacter sp. MB35-C1]WMJ75738.1 Fic family protein [Sedimentibacter sp. MB35-C1]
MSDHVYCYANSDVLTNKLNIRDSKILIEAERKLTMLRISDLIDTPIEGEFDLRHLQAIHKYIFQDIYHWAGEIRTVNISKGNMFCKAQYIEEQANSIFESLKKDNYLYSLGRDEMIIKLAYYFSEINALHPFREGNGRSQREFIRELALFFNYRIDFRKIDNNLMLEACKDSFLCNYSKMEELFNICLSEKL